MVQSLSASGVLVLVTEVVIFSFLGLIYLCVLFTITLSEVGKGRGG